MALWQRLCLGDLGAQQLMTLDEIDWGRTEGLMEIEGWVVSGWGVTWGGGVGKSTLASACPGVREDHAGGCPHMRGGPHTSGGWEWAEVMKSTWAGSGREAAGLADGGACGLRGDCPIIRSEMPVIGAPRVPCINGKMPSSLDMLAVADAVQLQSH